MPAVGCLRWPNPANGAANLLEDRTRHPGGTDRVGRRKDIDGRVLISLKSCAFQKKRRPRGKTLSPADWT